MTTVPNVYQSIPKKYFPKTRNPHYDVHGIDVNSRVLIVGGSGSMKTNTMVHLISLFKNTFNKLIICVKTRDEPLYKYLESKIDDELLEFYENGQVPPLGTIEKEREDDQYLIVFDDLVLEPRETQNRIAEYWIRSRKKQMTCFYLTQSFFRTPKVIRINSNYIFLKKLSSLRDLNIILSEFNLNCTKKGLLNMYNYATQEPTSFLLIDIGAPAAKRFRKNYTEILNPNDFEN